MGVIANPCGPTTIILLTLLQIRALISIKTSVIAVEEGQKLDLRCDYPPGLENNAKYLADDKRELIRTEKHNQWVRDGHFALYDNTSGAFFTIRLENLNPDDSGTYRCGVDVVNQSDHITVIELNVSRVKESLTTMDNIHLSLFLTAVVCVAAILFVCLFTVCLLLVVKSRRSGQRHNREVSCDYETMMPGVGPDPELCCTCSDSGRTHPPELLPFPAELCPLCTSKQRESSVSFGQYQHLDLSRVENHIYDSLQRDSDPKHTQAHKETINC